MTQNCFETKKATYYDVLEQAGVNWHEGTNDPTPFVKYILGVVLSAYHDFENRVSLVDEKLPAIELVRNATTEKIGKFTKSEIMELVPSVGKASVENSLKKLAFSRYTIILFQSDSHVSSRSRPLRPCRS